MVMLILVYKTFALIHGIQNEVLSWIGGHDQDMVGAGRSAEVLAGMITAAAMRAGSGPGGRVAGRKAKRADNEARQKASLDKAAKDHGDFNQ